MSFRLSIVLLLSAGPLAGWSAAAPEPRSARGIVRDVFRDDVDENYFYMSLDRDGKTAFVSTGCASQDETEREMRRLKKLVGSDVTATGMFTEFDCRSNRMVLKGLLVRRPSDEIVVHAPPSRNAFDAPDLTDEPPGFLAIDSCGPRSARGVVIARWNGDSILLRTAKDAIRVAFCDGSLPAIGESVEVVGRATTDLYRFNLERARWRPARGRLKCGKPVVRNESLKDVFSLLGHRAINSDRHGWTLCVAGTLKSILSDETGRDRILIEDGSYQMVVNCSALPGVVDGLEEGSELEVTGVGVMESESWHPGMVFPKVSGLFLVPRTAGDIRVLRHPPWWTPARMLAVVLGLLAVLAGILVWNASLRVLVARKSRALLREQAMKLSETLKIDERTRLAAELHDFHSQNLTAIAYRISSARTSCKDDPARTEELLTTAARMLKSCRTDLRRCLWDLRNDALDEPDFAKAVRETVLPVAGLAKVSVRFTGHRAQLSDSTAHALLSILRELTANAVVHGRAANVRIAGERLPQIIRFSVQDDGSGFDPSARLGQNDGHFGLDGILERLRRLGGTLDVESAPGRGTYVRLTVSHPTPPKQA